MISRKPFLCLGLFLFLLCSSARAQTSGNIDRAIARWKATCEKIKTAHFSWTEERFYPRGSLSWLYEEINARKTAMKLEKEPVKTIPPQDESFQVPVLLELSEIKMRYSYEGKSWNMDKDAWFPEPYVAVFDGTNNTAFREREVYVDWPTGVITKGKKHQETGNFNLLPLLISIRATDQVMAPIGTNNLVEMPGGIIGDQQCIILKNKGSPLSLWVNPSMGYSVARITIGKVLQIDIKYVKDPEYGFLPKSWNTIEMDRTGKIKYSVNATVTKYSINLGIADDRFQIKFPPGTRVNDLASKKEYVIKKSGEVRVIPQKDFGATYEQIINSDPGEAFAPKKSEWGYTVAIVLFGSIGAAGLFWLYVRRKNRPKSLT